MAYHICFSNPAAWEESYDSGVYGNVGTGNDNLKVFWGKLVDLLALKKNDYVYFYIKQESYLSGLYRVKDRPYYCDNDLFNDPNEFYPFRFNFEEVLHFENKVPINELARLIETDRLSSISTFERDRNAGFRGIRQITNEEGETIKSLFYKYNPKGDTNRVKIFNHPQINQELEASAIVESISNGRRIRTPKYIKFNNIPVIRFGGRYIVSYENILQGYIYYCIRHNKNGVIDDLKLNNFTQALMEVRILKAQQFRADLLVLYQIDKNRPHFFSLIETKKKTEITISHLSQLIGYMKTYASAKDVSFNSLEGIYISIDFEDETIEYLQNRKNVENENPIRLIRYSVNERGKVSFEEIQI